MTQIRVSIDALVLKGFRPEDRYAIAAGLEHELARLLGNPEFGPMNTTRNRLRDLNAGTIAIPHSARPALVGVAAARQIGIGLRS